MTQNTFLVIRRSRMFHLAVVSPLFAFTYRRPAFEPLFRLPNQSQRKAQGHPQTASCNPKIQPAKGIRGDPLSASRIHPPMRLRRDGGRKGGAGSATRQPPAHSSRPRTGGRQPNHCPDSRTRAILSFRLIDFPYVLRRNNR